MIRLNVVREGQGPIVVLSHGLGCDLHMWDGVAEQLARAHTVIRYDHRNHGASERVPGAHSLQTLGDDALALIQREAEGEPVHFVGLSMGGMTAQALAPNHPELLKSIVIANSSSHYPDAALWRSRIEALEAAGLEPAADGVLARWLTAGFLATPEGAAAAQRLRETLVGTEKAGYIASAGAVGAIDFRESNRRISTPTLVIAGTQDLSTPLAMSETMVADIPGAKLATIEASHLSAVERPEEFARLLIDFWRSL